MPPKLARVEEEAQENETMKDLSETKDELERVKETLLRTEEDRDMWMRLFKDCKNTQDEEIKRLRQDYKERWERVTLTTVGRTMFLVGNSQMTF